MPTSLLDSQFATLEDPTQHPEESPRTIPVSILSSFLFLSFFSSLSLSCILFLLAPSLIIGHPRRPYNILRRALEPSPSVSSPLPVSLLLFYFSFFSCILFLLAPSLAIGIPRRPPRNILKRALELSVSVSLVSLSSTFYRSFLHSPSSLAIRYPRRPHNVLWESPRTIPTGRILLLLYFFNFYFFISFFLSFSATAGSPTPLRAPSHQYPLHHLFSYSFALFAYSLLLQQFSPHEPSLPRRPARRTLYHEYYSPSLQLSANLFYYPITSLSSLLFSSLLFSSLLFSSLLFSSLLFSSLLFYLHTKCEPSDWLAA